MKLRGVILLATALGLAATWADAWMVPPGFSIRTCNTDVFSSTSVSPRDATCVPWTSQRQQSTNARRNSVLLRASTVKPVNLSAESFQSSGSSSQSAAAAAVAADTETASTVVADSSSPTAAAPSLLTSQQSVDPNWDDVQQKFINGVLLAVSFGYAAYTILNIDAGMTRGWTQSEIAMRIPLDNWSNYESSLAEKPVYTKTLINVVIYLLGDWLSQTVFQGKNVLDFDAGRTLKNGFIGLCFGPLVHEYYQFSDHILPVDGPLMNRIEKIFMDQSIYLTVKASIYVAAVSLLAGESWATAKENVQTKIGGIVITAWKFWPLVHCITYGVIPARHRILWVNCVDLVWNAILASMSSSRNDHQNDEAAAAVLEGSDQDVIVTEKLASTNQLVAEPIVLGQDISQELAPGAKKSLFNETSTEESSL